MTHASSQHRFETLIARHGGIVRKVAGMYCAHAEDRLDLAQEIRAQLWRAFGRYDESRPFATWMYRVALNVAITFARRAGVRERYTGAAGDSAADPIDEPQGSAEQDERVAALRRFIAELDGLNRALLFLYMEEQSYLEIAEVLGLSETNVATKIHRLKRRIQRDLRSSELY